MWVSKDLRLCRVVQVESHFQPFLLYFFFFFFLFWVGEQAVKFLITYSFTLLFSTLLARRSGTVVCTIR